ncbi:sensor domain-containing protein [Hydrogenimonas urashimensis]|uniref:sensor domain-containing protein n=1 Tax=Hydrogenimonas urashimensis TaxID=2740515 RepID=UPI001915A616|nr:EAL domain-containing protein [Hydrogenimonas urashimensis]
MERYEPQIRKDLIDLVYDSIPFSIIVNIMAGLVVLVVYWPKSGKNAVIWYGIVVGAMLYRLGIYLYYKAHQDEIPVVRAEVLQWIGMFASAVVWVSGLWYFLGKQGIAYDFLMAFVMGGMASGAITTLSSERITAITYVLITLGGTALWLLISPHGIEVMMGVMVVIYLAFLISSSGRIHKTIVDAMVLRRENEHWIRALRAHRAEIELIFDNVPVGIFFYDKEFNVVNVNQHFVQLFGSSRERLIGFNLEKLKDRRIVPAIRMPIDYNGLEDGYYEGVYHTTTSDIDVYIRMKTTALKDSKNRLVGAIGIVEDISQELEHKRQIESFAQFYIQNPNPVMQISCHSHSILIENDAARMIHVGLENTDPKRWEGFLENVCSGEHKSLDLRYEETVYQFDIVILDKERVNLYGRNVTKERIARERADYLAYYDELTGLPRRKLLFEHVKIAMLRAERNHTTNALLFLDLDNFKQINDSMGHDVGDYLLQQLAKRLTNLMRTGDIVTRLGGDEFVILLSDIEGDAEEAAMKSEIVARKIREEVARPFAIKGRKLHFSVSIGITLFTHDRDFFDLLKEADVAMYEAKSAGKNGVRIFDSKLEKSTMNKTELLQELHNAIEKNQLTLLYQPQIEISTGKCVGAEALLRWEHPKRGLVSPGIFIPLAEESGLIHELGQWVLRRVAQESMVLPLDYVAVNVSIKEFVRSDFIEMVKEMAEKGEIDPSRIELEMTESVFIENFKETNKKLQELRQMGFRFSIDDFGTGYSSLAYLKNLSIKTLKIDRGFVEDIGINPNDEVLSRTIIDIAAHFGMKTVAEGVENETQLAFLKKFGCDLAQGYYFSKPMPIETFMAWLGEKA